MAVTAEAVYQKLIHSLGMHRVSTVCQQKSSVGNTCAVFVASNQNKNKAKGIRADHMRCLLIT